MANAYTNSFIHNMGLNEKNSLPHLLDRISPEMENEASLIEHSKYYNDVEFRNVLHNTNSKIRNQNYWIQTTGMSPRLNTSSIIPTTNTGKEKNKGKRLSSTGN